MPQTLQSVTQALRILRLLQDEESLGVMEVADRLGIGPSTAHRLLSTLTEAKFVRQDGKTRRYRLGPVMRQSFGAEALQHCMAVAAPFMQTLRDRTGETSHLAILVGDRVRFVAVAESTRPMRVTSRVGQTLPADVTASGRVLLSMLDEVELKQLYDAGREWSVTYADLNKLLRAVREQGFARNIGEAEQGVASLAVPIDRPDAPPVAALTITGPAVRFDPRPDGRMSASEEALLVALMETASQVSDNLTY